MAGDEVPAVAPETQEGVEQPKGPSNLSADGAESEMNSVDQSRISTALARYRKELRERREATAARDRELGAVAIDAADVTLISEEMNLSAKDAERALRENGGDATKTLQRLVGLL